MIRHLRLVSIVWILLTCRVNGQSFSEILGRPEDHSITVNLLFSLSAEVYVEYGTISDSYSFSTIPFSVTAGAPAEAKLAGLASSTRYYYRTRYRLPGEATFKAGTGHTFVTQPSRGTSFTFTVESDPHPYDKKCYAPLWYIALQNQLNDKADFMIDMGDTFGDDHNPFTITNKEVQALHLDARNYFSRVCHSLPFFFCQGNHEGESGYYLLQTPPENLAVYETLWRKQYWPNPYPDGFYTGNTREEGYGIGLPGDYYAWEWGDALLVVLDAYRFYTASAKPGKWDWTIGKPQYDWLKGTLENSSSKFKFVFIHHLLGEARGAANLAMQFEWGGYDQKGTAWEFTANRPGWAMPIHQLLVKSKVSVLFQGHDHLYAKEELDGLVYQTVPMPSDSSYTLGMIANGDAFGGVKLTGSGHLRVTVSPEKATVDFISAVLPQDETRENKNGSVRYSYTVLPGGQTTGNTSLPGYPVSRSLSIFPDPLSGDLKISFALRNPSGAEIRITGITGKSLGLIHTGVLSAGRHTISWSPSGKPGRTLGPGMMICTVKTDEGFLSGTVIIPGSHP